MKKIALFTILLILSTFLIAQTKWKADPMHSKLTFSTIHNGISDINGLFKTFEISAITSKTDFNDAVFELSTAAVSISTAVEMRDKHLKSEEFFNVEKYPEMTFKRTSLQKKEKEKFKLTSQLTLHEITKPVVIKLWYGGTIKNLQSKVATASFKFSTIKKRSDFNMSPKFTAPMISDDVKIMADSEFVK